MQELVTQYCWGEVWNRPGLDRRTRSFLNLAMLTALNRPHELKLHVRGALNNGLTKDEIREVFLQSAIYCGVPAAIDSFRVAREVFKEMGI
jgi:4-carboxymuconolactone decarboxylase